MNLQWCHSQLGCFWLIGLSFIFFVLGCFPFYFLLRSSSIFFFEVIFHFFWARHSSLKKLLRSSFIFFEVVILVIEVIFHFFIYLRSASFFFGGCLSSGWVASYPLSSQAPTHVEVELGCDNYYTVSYWLYLVVIYYLISAHL